MTVSRTPRSRQRGDSVIAVFFLLLALCVFVGWVVGHGLTEDRWQTDCTKLKSHVASGGKVYTCEPKP